MSLTAIGNAEFVEQFFAGQRACQVGEQCPQGATEVFKRGYGAEYEMEQVKTWESLHAVGRNQRSA